jgi:hypothetical protein
MDLSAFNALALPIPLNAMLGVAPADGLTEPETRLLALLAELEGSLVHIGSVATKAREAAPAALPRKHSVQLAMMTAMIRPALSLARQREVRDVAAALAANDASFTLLDVFPDGCFLEARVNVARSPTPAGLRTLRDDLPACLIDAPDVAWRFKKLGLLPEGTLGREFWIHCTKNEFPFPGEQDVSEPMVLHDLAHVLAGYSTTNQDEILQGAFQAGLKLEDGWSFLFFVLARSAVRVCLEPVIGAVQGLFDPERVVRAITRGAACGLDVIDRWNFWALVDRRLDELRTELGVPPL